MKGTLIKTEQGWMVEYPISSFHSTLQELYLHPDDIKKIDVDYKSKFYTVEVEFEIVEVVSEKVGDKMWVNTYAKLIPKQDHNDETNEMMEKLAEEAFPIKRGGSMWMPTAHDLVQANKQEGFIVGYNKAKEEYTKLLDDALTYANKKFVDGYNKAKETLFTEEQVNEAIEVARDLDQVDASKIIQEIKQEKP